LSTATNLLESRFLCGDEKLFECLFEAITSDNILTSEEFFRAKIKEQTDRHFKLQESEYNLEPNVKNSPGGLRDIQTIGWITKRHFDNEQPEGLIRKGFLNDEDLEILNNGQHFLFQIRFALHIFSDRKQDRLLFEYQKSIAQALSFEDDKNSLGVEKLMKQYFRWVLALSELNEMLMQLFDETVLSEDEDSAPYRLNDRFSITRGKKESNRPNLFAEEPSALLEVFLLFCRNRNIKAVKASTIREIRENRHLIDDKFRKNSKNNHLFLKILQSKHRVASVVRLMLRFGILGKFIPAFGQIIGQTQLDLFHIYTVDAHTIAVLKNMRRFTYEDFDDNINKFPMAAKIIKTIKDKELLYLACLFHDIAKGRGGDHSVLGSDDAYHFCRQLGLSNRNSKLVSWLVKYHLYMSRTAQKRDISDPDVIQRFARRIGDKKHLDFLFLLTVADINATNPGLWTSWRAQLLRQLYHSTNYLFKLGLETIVDKQEIIAEKQLEALSALEDVDQHRIETLWASLGDDYFLREDTQDMVWHARSLIENGANENTQVFIRNPETDHDLGASQLFIYTKDIPHTFAKVTAFLEQKLFSVVAARVYSSDSGFTLDTFFIIDDEGQRIQLDTEVEQQVIQGLTQQLSLSDDIHVERRTSRQLKFFSLPTDVRWMDAPEKDFTILEVTTADRPGLLAIIGEVFKQYDIDLIDAKIATLGERVEDIFYIKSSDGHPIQDTDKKTAITSLLCEKLDQQVERTSQ
jgi:[protein-PII] uridylyltransferase